MGAQNKKKQKILFYSYFILFKTTKHFKMIQSIKKKLLYNMMHELISHSLEL